MAASLGLLESWQRLAQRYGHQKSLTSLQDLSPAAVASIVAGMFQESLTRPFANETQACQAALDFLAQDVLGTPVDMPLLLHYHYLAALIQGLAVL
jgi:hypothetical protein